MALQYTAAFTSDKGLACELEIYGKDYVGTPIEITLTGTPVVHTWQTDEAKPAIKGSELAINILNRGVLPITDFIADEDDYFKVVLIVDGGTVFEGYLVQDDYDEILVDFPHEISLKATDNLGLLKDVSLGDAAITFGERTPFFGQTVEQTAANKLKITGTFSISPNVLLIIDTGTALDGQYAVKTWENLAGPFTEVTFETDLNGTVVGTLLAAITHIMPVDLTERKFLSEVLALCLKSTNLPLDIRVYGTIFPDGAADDRLFDNVMITPQSFLSGEKWNSCYDVIARIVGRAGFTLLQAEGFWNLVRWDELKLHANEIPGFSYDSDFVYVGTITLDNQFVTGFEQETFPEEGLAYTIQRPLKFDRETYNYRNPENIVNNINFQDVGEFVGMATTVDSIFYTYKMVGWEQGFEYTTGGLGYIGSTAERLIRVVTDLFGNEKERYGVVKGNSGFDDTACIQSNGVEIRIGDTIEWSFEWQTNLSLPGPFARPLLVKIITTANPVPRSPNNKRLRYDGDWYSFGDPIPPNTGIVATVTSGSNANEWTSFSVVSKPSPVDGLLYLNLAQIVAGNSLTKETRYKNLKFKINRQVIGSNRIIGHQHTSSQLLNIKNTEENEIYTDSSPSSAIAGTLFLESFTGPLQDLVTTWDYNGTAYQKLGHITTRDELFWRRISRLKLEGTFYQLKQESKILSALSVLTYAQFTGDNFVSGKLSLDYKRDKASCTLFAIYNDSEDATDLKEIYGFKYLYERG